MDFGCGIGVWSQKNLKNENIKKIILYDKNKELIKILKEKYNQKKVEINFNFKESLKIALIPASFFSLQNFLIQQAYQELDGLHFTLLNQSKIIWTGIFIYLLTKKKQTKGQISCLLIILTFKKVVKSVC